MTVTQTPVLPWPAPERTEVRIGFLALSDCAAVIVAVRKHFDRRFGLRIVPSLAPSWAALRDRLLGGEIDAAHGLYGLVYGVELGIGGPQQAMAILMGLSSNGQAISFSQRLIERGIQDGAGLAAAIQRGEQFTFANTFPTGTHAMWLYHWFAGHGIHPLRDVRMISLPPAQMVERLGDGSIDGCCVGEPWGALAVARGVGATIMTSQQIWPDHPEKVLCTRAAFADAYPGTAHALTAALLSACRWLDQADNRREAIDWISHAEVIGEAPDIIGPRFLGQYQDGLGHAWQDAHGLRFFDEGRVNCPWWSDGLWFLGQFRRWNWLAATTKRPTTDRTAADSTTADPGTGGPTTAGFDADAIVQRVQRWESYARVAGALGVAVPSPPLRAAPRFPIS